MIIEEFNSLKWKERKGGKEAEREWERRGSARGRDEESMIEREIDGGMSW